MIGEDFRLNLGVIEDTGYKIPSRVEDNKTLFDIIQNARDETVMNRKKMYVLYDDMGLLTLKDLESLKPDVAFDDETAENFDYTSSIDADTYNQIKLVRNDENEESAASGPPRQVCVYDLARINEWGVLQFFEKLDANAQNPQAKAEALLSLYNQKTRKLTLSNALGDKRVRGGSAVGVKLNLGDILVSRYMMVEKVKHTFGENSHTMNLTLIGGAFIA
jgi:hypothetical protein